MSDNGAQRKDNPINVNMIKYDRPIQLRERPRRRMPNVEYEEYKKNQDEIDMSTKDLYDDDNVNNNTTNDKLTENGGTAELDPTSVYMSFKRSDDDIREDARIVNAYNEIKHMLDYEEMSKKNYNIELKESIRKAKNIQRLYIYNLRRRYKHLDDMLNNCREEQIIINKEKQKLQDRLSSLEQYNPRKMEEDEEKIEEKIEEKMMERLYEDKDMQRLDEQKFIGGAAVKKKSKKKASTKKLAKKPSKTKKKI